MLIREIIELKGWTNGSGWNYTTVYNDKVEKWSIEEFENLEANFDFWYTGGEETDDRQDLLIKISYLDLDDNVLKEFEIWENDLIKERMGA